LTRASKKAPKKRSKRPSPLEEAFAAQLTATGIEFQREYRALPSRLFRWDFFVPDNLLIEINGGLWMPRGGHNSGAGLMRDYEKQNLAVIAGFRQLSLAPNHVKSGEGVEWVKELVLREVLA
jgi:hypothetical protein